MQYRWNTKYYTEKKKFPVYGLDSYDQLSYDANSYPMFDRPLKYNELLSNSNVELVILN